MPKLRTSPWRRDSTKPASGKPGAVHSLGGLEASVADFQDRINQDPIALADRLALKTHLDPDIEKLRISM